MKIAQAKEYRKNPNVRAFLEMIGKAEGAGYHTLVNKGAFNNAIKDLSRHPNIKVGGKYPSTAAGKYQFLFRTWETWRKRLNLPDFSPESQDLACIAQLAEVGALQPIIKGDIETAIKKSNRIWASFYGSPYGQGSPHSLQKMVGWFKSFRGQVSETVANVTDTIADNSGGLTMGAAVAIVSVLAVVFF